MYYILEIIGTIAFAVSGAMVGIEKKMDVFGVAALGATTAVGGGIIRDIIIGVIPPSAFQQPIYILIALAVSMLVFTRPVRKRIDVNSPILILIDSIGLGVFTVLGVKAGIDFHNAFLQIFLGTVTGTGGGVLRDIFANEKPMIFVKHFYASAALIGAAVCVVLYPYNDNLAMIIGILTIAVLRLLAARFRWHLPKA